MRTRSIFRRTSHMFLPSPSPTHTHSGHSISNHKTTTCVLAICSSAGMGCRLRSLTTPISLGDAPRGVFARYMCFVWRYCGFSILYEMLWRWRIARAVLPPPPVFSSFTLKGRDLHRFVCRSTSCSALRAAPRPTNRIALNWIAIKPTTELVYLSLSLYAYTCECLICVWKVRCRVQLRSILY